jgi:hypothetical protein
MNLESGQLNVDDQGIKLSRSAIATGGTLCDYCSLQSSCEVFPVQNLDRCPEFTPALSFVPPLIGLEGAFSTFRASSIWYDRARVIFRSHKQVGLFNAKTKERIGLATLTGAFRGRFEDLMKSHANSNHLARDRGMSAEEAGPWLAKQIRNLAGSRYVKSPDQICTVLYLERVQ